MTAFYWIIIVLLLIPAAVVCTDFVSGKWSAFRRFHIGRWTSREEWALAVKKTACKWLRKTPAVKKTDRNSYILLDWLRKSNQSKTIQSWQEAGLILGLQGIPDCRERIEVWKQRTLEKSGMWKAPIARVDFAMLAHAVLKTEDNPGRVRPAMDWTVQMLEANLCDDGMISYSQGKDSKTRFVDTLGMVCPFLALYGTRYGDERYVRMAYHQIRQYRQIGLYPGTNLPCHAVDAEQRLPLGVYGWGRGTLWYMIALVDTFSALPEGDMKQDLSVWITQAADAYIPFQMQDGGFCTILQGGGQYDSSVTAGMAFFYRQAAKITGRTEYTRVADKCLDRLMKVTMRNGAVDQCQGDTHGIGIFSQVFDTMPFVQGLVLRAIYE